MSDSRHSRAWSALRRPLTFAARDGFARLDDVADLGPTLAGAAARLVEVLGAATPAELRAYAEQLCDFDQASQGERVRLVALGLRLCAGRGAAEAAAPRRGAPDGGTLAPDAPLTALRGVGPTLARRLAKRGLERLEDLLYLLPLEYRDQRELTALVQVAAGQRVTTRGIVVESRRGGRGRRRRFEAGLAPLAGEPVRLWCVWFGNASFGLAERLAKGTTVLVSGVVRSYRERLQIAHPDLEIDGERGRVRLRYPQIDGVAPRLLERICGEVCAALADDADDAVPAALAGELGLPPQAEALRIVHQVDQPEPDGATVAQLQRGEHLAQERLAFDELFSLQLALAQRRAAWGAGVGHPCRLRPATRRRLAAALPFSLTAAQRRVVDELLADVGHARPMHRLLQGDVGSGKTVVALTACLAAIDSGYQAALMAPTEVLATQHHRQLAPLLEALGLRCALLTAATPRSARESLLALADGGRVDLLVGTHALLAARVSLPNLALAVVDEQHRFGVAQRVRLRQRGGDGCQPHLLVMTATPIPRTMALTLYGDLELSLLDEKPPGRRRIATELHEQPRLTTSDAARARLRGRLERGEQAFVVCPLVEESEKLAVTDVANTTAELARLLPQRRVATVHGRMPSAERDRVMAAFRRREIDVLVATTVIEVGIDVPNANVMVVEHAERFGLAQLHQLRGRVGRAAGERAGLCLLLTTAAESTARERLEVLASTDDGFVIAEADLELRGAGELFGTRQAGVPRLRFADPRRQLELLAKAKRAAEQLVSADPQLGGHPRLRQIVERRWERKPLFGVEAG